MTDTSSIEHAITSKTGILQGRDGALFAFAADLLVNRGSWLERLKDVNSGDRQLDAAIQSISSGGRVCSVNHRNEVLVYVVSGNPHFISQVETALNGVITRIDPERRIPRKKALVQNGQLTFCD